ncbi:hypothetical protein [Variovorax sp. Root411]|uniref:hypothetical protein n=1 Tax=Variovorax sp. Root411 TaxID=1736530 RepID=UPI0012F9B7E1|nr:hypothetical protein [Variovorax sp. Root411]
MLSGSAGACLSGALWGDTLAALLANPDEFAKSLRAGQVPMDRRLVEALDGCRLSSRWSIAARW